MPSNGQKLRNEYAEDWPNNQRTDICHKKFNNVTNPSDQMHVQNGPHRQNPSDQAEDKESDKSDTTASTHQGKGEGTDKQKGAPHSRHTPTLGKPRRVTILLKSSSQKEQPKNKKYCCD